MQGTFLFLGTSSSAGVPKIGCECAVCRSTDPKNRRFRPSGLVRVGGRSLLIDIGPDFHAQALRFQIRHLDGLLLTHTHYDHIAGIDELRVFNIAQKRPFPCLLSQESFRDLKKRYYYFFEEGESTKLNCQVLEGERGEVEFLGVRLGHFRFAQDVMGVTGFRFGDLAYVSDIKKYDEAIFEALQGVRTLIVSALRPEPSPFHLSFKEAVAFAKRVGAERAWITHVGHFLDHEAFNALLPSQVRVAYDGLELEFMCTN